MSSVFGFYDLLLTCLLAGIQFTWIGLRFFIRVLSHMATPVTNHGEIWSVVSSIWAGAL